MDAADSSPGRALQSTPQKHAAPKLHFSDRAPAQRRWARKSNCYYGAWALSSESAELPLASATARVSATKAFQLCSKENIQTHGGNGFTWEYDCHLFYKRSKVLSILLGSEATWKEKLVTSLEKTNTLEKG